MRETRATFKLASSSATGTGPAIAISIRSAHSASLGRASSSRTMASRTGRRAELPALPGLFLCRSRQHRPCLRAADENPKRSAPLIPTPIISMRVSMPNSSGAGAVRGVERIEGQVARSAGQCVRAHHRDQRSISGQSLPGDLFIDCTASFAASRRPVRGRLGRTGPVAALRTRARQCRAPMAAT